MFPPELEHRKVTEDSSFRGNPSRHTPIASSKARSKSLWFVVIWLAVGAQLLALGLEVFAPILSGDVSLAGLKEALWRAAIVLGVLALGGFYDSTPVDHLSGVRRAFTNLLLCIGGIALLASLVLIRFDHYGITFVSIVVCVLSLLWAKSNST